MSNHDDDSADNDGSTNSPFPGSKSSFSEKNPQSNESMLARKETTAVNRLRIVVLLALFFAAAVISLTVFFVTRRAEKQQFESEFQGSAVLLLNNFNEIVQQKILAITSFSEHITSYTKASNSTWPYVVVPDFAEQSESVSLPLLPAGCVLMVLSHCA